MSNLLKETTASVIDSGHTVDQIVFIGSSDGEYRCSWDEFTVLADHNYDSGFGGQEVAQDLIVLFSDGRKMWRGEYDGSEWWEFDSAVVFDYSKPGKPIRKLMPGAWNSVFSMNHTT